VLNRLLSLALGLSAWAFSAGLASAIETPDLSKPKRIYTGPEYTLGLDIWYLNNNGHMQLEGGQKIVIPRDAELGEGSNVYPVFFQVRRIGPFIPNFRLHSYRYRYASGLKYTENTRFGGVTYSPGSRVSLDVYAIGLLAFYTANPLNSVEVQYGFELRRFGGEVGLTGEDANLRSPRELKYDITGEVISYLPLAHVGATYRLTNPALHFTLEGEALKISDYAYYDGRAMVRYQLFGLMIGAGYRHSFFGGKIELDESSVGMHAKGTFFRVSYSL